MTGPEERALLSDYLATCARLNEGFARAVEKASAALPVAVEDIDRLTPDLEDMVLAYLKRFEQFEDALGRTLKTVSQLMALGRVERLTPRDVANKAEAFGIVDAERWAEAVRTRNALAHEYPLRPDKRARQLNRAWNARSTLTETWNMLAAFVDQEKLVHGRL